MTQRQIQVPISGHNAKYKSQSVDTKWKHTATYFSIIMTGCGFDSHCDASPNEAGVVPR